ncbi:MAG: CDP-alcohol phosphatidyltransferase family protein [Proteobacteria bacterium]|nr:CDP-alcohol phosphatidyltransferase family protein [Pseudomonadota bacterium]MDA1024131.1 CDP-alcohol phosphatidyltransferase family protein [Pseudomonadota bacterium]
MNGQEKIPLFPLVRHLSKRVTPLLARLPVTANQITVASLAFGLGACWLLMTGGYREGVIAAGLFVVAYILDNCDGEIARLKGQSSTFGMWFDTTVDWIIHSAFFAALGVRVASVFGNDIWLWLGLIAALGGTINFFLGIYLYARDRDSDQNNDEPAPQHRDPESVSAWVVFFFRELSRADFCFIVLGLALSGWLWVLLPAAAIGSQVYWIMQFAKGARDYHA